MKRSICLDFRFVTVGLLAAGVVACASPKQAMPSVAESQAVAFLPEAAVNSVVAGACAQCHSDEGRAPWYGDLAPSYWFSAGARKKLNFSDWPQLDRRKRAEALEAIEKVVESGDMPPWDYTFLDRSARLDAAQRQTVVDWAEREAGRESP